MKNILQISGLICILLFSSSCGYNKIVDLEEQTNTQWGNVEATYQRRADLMQQLLSKIKSYEGFNQQLVSQLESDQKNAQISLSPEDLNSESKIQNYLEQQSKLSETFFKASGEIRSNSNYDKVMEDFLVQVEGTENRLKHERIKYNRTVGEFNSYIRAVPQNFTSGMMGFDEKAYFKAESE